MKWNLIKDIEPPNLKEVVFFVREYSQSEEEPIYSYYVGFMDGKGKYDLDRYLLCLPDVPLKNGRHDFIVIAWCEIPVLNIEI